MSLDPKTIDVPEALSTERLVLRAPHPDYAVEMNDAVCESIEELRPWMPWAQHAPSVEESRAQQASAREAFLAREDLQLILFRGGRIVGSTGLHRIDWEVPKFETGYWVRTSEEGQGFATEAVEAVTELAFEQLGARRLEIRASTRNTRSRAIPERLGFALEGVLRHDARHADGDLRDTAVYARVR